MKKIRINLRKGLLRLWFVLCVFYFFLSFAGITSTEKYYRDRVNDAQTASEIISDKNRNPFLMFDLNAFKYEEFTGFCAVQNAKGANNYSDTECAKLYVAQQEDAYRKYKSNKVFINLGNAALVYFLGLLMGVVVFFTYRVFAWAFRGFLHDAEPVKNG